MSLNFLKNTFQAVKAIYHNFIRDKINFEHLVMFSLRFFVGTYKGGKKNVPSLQRPESIQDTSNPLSSRLVFFAGSPVTAACRVARTDSPTSPFALSVMRAASFVTEGRNGFGFVAGFPICEIAREIVRL